MSDMIDRLDAIASEAGADASARLATPDVTARLATQVRRGARRRRAVGLSVAAAVVLLAGAAGIVVPQLMRPEPIAPADNRVPIETTEGLITYNDGSMQVLTESGALIDVPAPVPTSPVFAQPSTAEACAADPAALAPGLTASFYDAFRLVSFGRPVAIDEAGAHHLLVQGQLVPHQEAYKDTKLAFVVDVDPAIAPHVVMTMTAYALAADGSVQYYSSQLESQPSIEYVGDPDAGTYTAVLTTRGMLGGVECAGGGPMAPDATGKRYLVVNMFVNDGAGHVNPIATHSSWITLVKESA